MNKALFAFLITTLSCAMLAAQVSTNANLQLKMGLVGDQRNQSPTYESFDTNHDVEVGLNWSAGIIYQRGFKKNFGFSIGLMYEEAEFTRLENYSYRSPQNIMRSGEISRQFFNQSLLLPLQYLLQFKNIGFTAGMITNVHLRTSMEQEQLFFEEAEELLRLQNTYTNGDFTVTAFGDSERIYLDRDIDFQWVLGAYLHLTAALRLEIEYKDFVARDNLLIYELRQNDVVGPSIDTFDALASSISLGISWLIR